MGQRHQYKPMATIEKRISKDGKATYRAKVRRRGELPRTRTFHTRKEADQWARAVETDLDRGEHVHTGAERRMTLGALIDRYTDEYLPTKEHGRDSDGQKLLLEWWKQEYGQITLNRLTPSLFSEARALLTKKPNGRRRASNAPIKPISGATVNRYLAAISAVCKWAWKELQLLQRNPVLSVSKRKEPQGVIRFLSDDERRALLKACREHGNANIRTLVILALATGARYSDMRNLQWDDVDMVNWRLRFKDPKNGEPRYVPVVGMAQQALENQHEADPTGTGWVFKGYTDDAPEWLNGKVWREVRDAAGLHNFRFHDLRHTTASYLTQNGAGLAQVADALGQKTLAMAKRYSHQSGEHVRATLSTIADKLAMEDE